MICGKVPYSSRQEAEQAISGIKRKSAFKKRSKKKPVQPYHCDDCKAWHVTSNKKKPKIIKPSTFEVSSVVKQNNRTLKIQDLTFFNHINQKP